MKIEKINNRVNYIKVKNDKFKTFTVSFYFHNTLSKETASLNALLPYVMKTGSGKYKDMTEISNALEDLYGGMFDCSIRKKGEDHIIGFNFEFVSNKYVKEEGYIDKVFDFIFDVLFNPLTENGGFSKENTEREKINLINYIESLINDKKEYASLRCTEEMCKGDNYAVFEYGEIDRINKIDEKGLYKHYLDVIKNSRVDIFVMGNIDFDSIDGKIYNIQFEDGNVSYPSCDIKKEPKEIKEIEESFDVAQGKISMGFTIGECDRYALTVFNSVYGSGAHSKLFNNVREKLSLCYYAYSRIDNFKGIMKVNSGVEFKNFKKAYDEILLQLEDVKDGNISPAQLDASKKSVINSLKSLNDSLFSMENYILNGLIKGEITEISEYIKGIEEVTVSDIVKVASKVKLDTVYYLTGSNVTGGKK